MDSFLLNSWVLNWTSTTEEVISTSASFSFDWYSLDNWTTRRITYSDHDNLWTIAYETYDFPRIDWWDALARYYRNKNITIKLCLKASSNEWLNDLIDELKLATNKVQWNLDIIINWIVRRRKATLTKLDFWRQAYNIDFLQDVTLTFSCINPISFNLSSISETYNWLSGNFAAEISYTWKVSCFPTIYLIIQWVNDLSKITIEMNWYFLHISEEFLPWDVVLIDWESKLVKINWVNHKYSWPFPVLESWINHMEITLNSWWLANYNAVLIYQKKYL